MSLENRPGQQSEWVEIDPPELTEDKKIHRGNATRNASRLLHGLDRLGLQLTKPYKVSGVDLLTLKLTPGKFNIVHSDSIAEIPYHTTLLAIDDRELIRDSTHDWKGSSFYSITADMDYKNQPLSMLIDVEPNAYEKYKLSLIMRTRIAMGQEVSLDWLPLNFRSVGFKYDFHNNPKHRERLSDFSKKRVDMDMVSGDPLRQSAIFGHQTPNGINAVSRLYLQTPNHFRHLKCYEVELFGLEDVGQGKERFLADTEEVVPESHWQEDERHYCMTGDTESLTYPLLPIKELGKISTFSMEIHHDDRHADPKMIHRLLKGFPLSVEGTNQWYATGFLGDGHAVGNVELLFKPEWGNNNAALVYHQTSSKRIPPEEIHNTVVGLNDLKTAITERLAT